jgi:hypothetical protein
MGALMQEGGSAKLKVRNVADMLRDLDQYIVRASGAFSQKYPSEIMSAKSYVQGSRAVLNKVLEPLGATEQSVDIKVNPQGIKVGNYDLEQLGAVFGEAMGATDVSKRAG